MFKYLNPSQVVFTLTNPPINLLL